MFLPEVVQCLLVVGLLLVGRIDEGAVLVSQVRLFASGLLQDTLLLHLHLDESLLVGLGTLLLFEVGHGQFLL